ncbi:MAG: diguanylate cyclase, partial [Clostridia bacterium]|nr:diguanylate cyclase [Clostridia bacterium]
IIFNNAGNDAALQKYQMFIDNVSYGVLVFDRQGKITDANKEAQQITGYDKEELLTLKYFDLLSLNSSEDFYIFIETLSRQNSACFEYINKNGKSVFLITDCVKISENEYMAINIDVSNNKIIKDKLYYSCNYDEMTGLYNRNFIFNKLSSYNKDTSLLPVSVIIGDINGLKEVNEQFGRDTGDFLLKETAELIKNTLSEQDIAGRWGCDEFIIISVNSDESRVYQIISDIKNSCKICNKNKTNLSLTFGHAIKESKKESFEYIINCAENSMRKNKIYEGISFRSQTINLILNTLQEKNKREEQHSIRVSRICVEIGKAINLPESEINKLKVIGLLHDIGKIGVSENILNKMGRLTESEFEQIKKHSEIGYRILSSSSQTSEIAQDVLDHHERFDGGGYPRGKMGSKLSLMTKILTIADSYDAMTSERPYKNPLSKSEAIDELIRHSAKQFDPNLVDVFINSILKNAEIVL